jgi:predicted deacylase
LALLIIGGGTAAETVDDHEAPHRQSLPAAAAEQAPAPTPESSDSADTALPPAVSVDLEKPVPENALEPVPAPSPQPEAVVETDAVEAARPLVLLGKQVAPGIASRLSWEPAQSFDGLASPTPVLVANGTQPGPTLCLTAAVHGDEINGIEIVRRILYNTRPEDLTGAIIGVPIVNLQGFQRGSRYLPDRRDLNRYFPGSPSGSSASRIAYSFFHEIIEHCHVLVDLHTGSFDRTNLPQLRADLTRDDVVELTKGFGATVVLHSEGSPGTLRRATVEHGIPAITVEVGGPMRLEEEAIRHAVKSIHTLLNHLGMVRKTSFWGDPEPVYYNSLWVRADVGGILQSEVELGERVKRDEILGTVTNPITNVRVEVRSPFDGRILGMALDQVVMPGYAAYHVGISAEAGGIPGDVTTEAVPGDPFEAREQGVEEVPSEDAEPLPISVDEQLESD